MNIILQKYWADFPHTTGDYRGRYWFFTKKNRREFIERAKMRGVDVSEVTCGEIKP